MTAKILDLEKFRSLKRGTRQRPGRGSRTTERSNTVWIKLI